MNDFEMSCPKCQGTMSEGFVADRVHNFTQFESEWSKGTPIRSFWGGFKNKTRIPIVVYRCESCGFLESYACIQEDDSPPQS